MPDFAFFQRPYPNANCVLLHGSRPVLVDTGYSDDTDGLERWLRAQGVPPENLSLIVNTHHHSDHVGGNHHLQAAYGIPIAAQRWEAALVNRRDPEAWSARWLVQSVEPYVVDRLLGEGDLIDTGDVVWDVVAIPGHTIGQIGLHARGLGVVVLGDAVHGDDVGWLNPYRESTSVLEQSLETLAKIAALAPRIGFSGHGAAVSDVVGACARASARLRRWREAPEAAAWHACKRIFAHALIVAGGLTEADAVSQLRRSPWVHDYAVHAFGLAVDDFIPLLLAEMLRSGAAQWRDGKLSY